MVFRLIFKERALKDLRKIPTNFRNRLFLAMDRLKTEPFAGKKLQGELHGLYSLRVWPYRVIYQVRKKEVIVIILHIGHRQGVYKG